MPLLVHSPTAGKSAASPRSGEGRVLADWVHRGRPVVVGKTPAVTSGRTTTGHSSPLALWTVISLTLSAGVGAEVSSPRSNSSAASRKARNARRLGSPSRSAKDAAWSRKATRPPEPRLLTLVAVGARH